MTFLIEDIRWAAENAKRQMVGPMRVVSMLLGMDYAMAEGRWMRPPTELEIQHIAALVEPDTNLNGYRNVSIMVGGHIGADWHELPRLVGNLVEAHVLSADEWYREYESIHPFGDGNGRSGAILWNIHRWRDEEGNVGVWEHPPDFYDRGWFQ